MDRRGFLQSLGGILLPAFLFPAKKLFYFPENPIGSALPRLVSDTTTTEQWTFCADLKGEAVTLPVQEILERYGNLLGRGWELRVEGRTLKAKSPNFLDMRQRHQVLFQGVKANPKNFHCFASGPQKQQWVSPGWDPRTVVPTPGGYRDPGIRGFGY